MKTGLLPACALAILCAVSHGLAAEEPADQSAEDAEKRLSEMLCERYGPDYELVPGTTTCIKVDGYIGVDIYVRSRSGRNKSR